MTEPADPTTLKTLFQRVLEQEPKTQHVRFVLDLTPLENLARCGHQQA